MMSFFSRSVCFVLLSAEERQATRYGIDIAKYPYYPKKKLFEATAYAKSVLQADYVVCTDKSIRFAYGRFGQTAGIHQQARGS
jgi:hypothetical protein